MVCELDQIVAGGAHHLSDNTAGNSAVKYLVFVITTRTDSFNPFHSLD